MHRLNQLLIAPVIIAIALVGSLSAGCPGSATTTTTTTTTTPAGVGSPAGPDARPAAPTAARKVAEVEGISEYVLDNGLRVLLFPDASQARVTVNITYFVGSRHEGYGEAGMAHLLEHMVFKGTPTHPDIWKLLEQHGARFNGTTWVDRTNYYETLPASDENLAFALALEADRMVNSTIAADALAKEFSVVRNEFEMGENDPRAVLDERMHSAAFLWHNYGKSTIGNKSDIERVPADSLRRFYQRYYQPDNAMLVVAGRFEPQKALDLVQQHFGPIPRPERTLSATYTVEPVQDGEREVVLRRAGDVGLVGLLYHGVPGAHADWVATDALTHILADEPSGRLYKALVETGMAAKVYAYAFAWADPGTIVLFAEVPPGKPLEPVRDRMIAIVEGLGQAPGQAAGKGAGKDAGKGAITDSEVSRYKARQAKDFELAMTSSQRIAVELSEWASMGDWRLMFVNRDRVEALATDHVREVAKNYLKRANRTLGLFIPTKAPDRAPEPGTPDVLALTRDYKGKGGVSEGEEFVATIENVESRTRRFDLPGGMKVAFLPKETRGDSVRMTLTIHFATERDLTGKVRAAEMIPDMLMRGSKKRSYQEVRDELDRLKAQVSFGSGGFFGASSIGATSASITTTRDNLPAVVALIAELMKEPAFLASELEIVRKEKLAELEEAQNDPLQLAFVRLFRQLYPFARNDVRYVPGVAEEIEQIKKVKLADLKDLHARFWGAASAEVAVVGDFDAVALEAALNQHFGSWKAKKPFQRVATAYTRSAPGSEVIKTPDKQNAFVAVAHSIDILDTDADYPALEMATYILAGSASSRLLERLRQKEGLSYGAFGGVYAGALDRHSPFFAGAICAPENAHKALQFMVEEIRLLVDKGVSEKELAEAKKSYALQFDNRLATDSYLASALKEGLFVGRTMEYQKQLNDQIQKLTPADIKRALDKYIHPDQLFQVRAGDFQD
jgi:zinc protease